MTIGELEIKKNTLEEKVVLWKLPEFLSLSTGIYYEAPIFKFLQANWYLTIDPCEYEDGSFEPIALHINAREIKQSCLVRCSFSVKNSDGSTNGIGSFNHTFSNLNVTLIVQSFFSKSDLLQCKFNFLPLGCLNIICKLQLIKNATKLTELNTLSENIKGLFTNGEHCDTTLQLGDKEFKAHKIILAARSPVFAAMFKHDTSEKMTGIVNIPDCDPDSFHVFLEFLYCGKIENVSLSSAFHLYKTAEKYDVQELKEFCVLHMKRNMTVENVLDVVIFADEYMHTDLLAAAQHFFNRRLDEIFVSAKWKDFFQNNSSLANKLLIQMASKVKVVA